MFHYKGLEIETSLEVYDPAEDTFLLLDSIDIKKFDSVFEIGTGCGIIALYCAKLGANVICSDINPFAITLVKENLERNKSNIKGTVEIQHGDLFSVLKPKEKFDIIIFNPPYLPSKKDDLIGGNGWFDKAVDGGIDGLSAIRRFIEGLNKHLESNGKAYFVFSSLSDRKKLEKIISKSGFEFKIVNSKKFDDETLDVYILSKKTIIENPCQK